MTDCELSAFAGKIEDMKRFAQETFMPYAEAVGKIIEEGRPWELRCVKTEEGFKFIRRSSKDKNGDETVDS
ncbi:MAG: hypothetical protein IIZ93_00445 [Acidaminococcaceae bacterium]|nr:hypothetical protein [Acidaminococcaceae bacterium]